MWHFVFSVYPAATLACAPHAPADAWIPQAGAAASAAAAACGIAAADRLRAGAAWERLALACVVQGVAGVVGWLWHRHVFVQSGIPLPPPAPVTVFAALCAAPTAVLPWSVAEALRAARR